MKVFVIVMLLVVGFMAFNFLWPKLIDLHQIGTVKEWPLTEVSGEDASINKKTNAFVMEIGER